MDTQSPIAFSEADFFESPFITMVKDGEFIYGRFCAEINLDLNAAKTCVRQRISFSKGKSYLLVIDMTGIRNISREAREYMAREGSQLITAGALIAKSPVSKILGNLFISLNPPGVPVKIFTDDTEAIKWLEQFEGKHNEHS